MCGQPVIKKHKIPSMDTTFDVQMKLCHPALMDLARKVVRAIIKVKTDLCD